MKGMGVNEALREWRYYISEITHIEQDKKASYDLFFENIGYGTAFGDRGLKQHIRQAKENIENDYQASLNELTRNVSDRQLTKSDKYAIAFHLGMRCIGPTIRRLRTSKWGGVV